MHQPPLPSPPPLPVPPSAVARPRVELRLLGTAALSVEGRASAALAPKDALLLALLALDGAMPRERLALMLWPDSEPSGGRTNLRQRVKKLQDQSGHELLLLQGRSLALSPQVRLDLSELPVRLRADPAAAQGRLLDQLDVDNDDTAGQWLERARQRANSQRNTVLLALAQSLEDQRQTEPAVALHGRLIAENPLDEAAVRRLMQLHFRHGDRNAAMRVYRALVERLHEQQQKPPDTQTRELAELVENTAVHEPVQAPAAAAWAALLRPPHLVQREAEWAQLQQSWLLGAVILVSGEAGIGKTRLIGDFADAMAVPLRLRAHHGDSALPYALLARWVQAQTQQTLLMPALPEWARAELARLVPALGPPAPGPVVPLHLAQALQLLAAPLAAVLLDDLHFADAASLDMLPSVLGSVRCCLLASRTLELPLALQHWLDQAGQPVLRLNLGPWTEAGVRALLHSTALPLDDEPGWVRLLWRHTGGHPLLLLETLRAWLLARPARRELGAPPAALPMSPQVLQLVVQRLKLLPDSARRVLQVAALAGDAFGPELAAAVLDQPVAWLAAPWAELTAAALMTDSGRVHDLVLQAARQTLPAPLSLVLHKAMGAHLATKGTEPARLAMHWEAGGDPAQAAACHEAAAARSTGMSRRHEAIHHWAQAAAQWSLCGQTQRAFEAGAEEAENLIVAGQPGPGLQRAEALSRLASSPRELVLARRLQGLALVYSRQFAQALPVLELAHQGARALGELKWHVETVLVRANAAALAGQRELAAACLEEAQTLKLEGAPWQVQLDHQCLRSDALLHLNRVGEALAGNQASLALADRPEAGTTLLQLRSNRALMLHRMGRHEQALHFAREAVSQAEALGEDQGMTGGQARVQRGLLALSQGEFREAIEQVERGSQVLDALGVPIVSGIARNHQAWLWTVLGRADRALPLLPECVGSDHLMLRLRRWTLRSELRRICGSGPAEPVPVDMDQCADPNTLAGAALALARELPPEQRLQRCTELAHDFDSRSLAGCALHARLLLLQPLASADKPAAARLAQDLRLQLRTAVPNGMYWPEALWIVHAGLLALGEDDEARQVLAEARAWITERCALHLADEHTVSFLQRNRINVAILSASARSRY